MKTLRAAAAAILISSCLAAAPATAQSGGSSAGAWMVPLNQPRLGPDGGAGRPGRPGGGGWWNDGRHDRHDWRKRCLRRRTCGYYGFGGYGYGGIGDDSLLANAYGYFAQGGSGVEARGGSARFDYDRGYPYEYYSDGERGETRVARRDYRSRECAMEATRDRRSGRQVDVRVCRN